MNPQIDERSIERLVENIYEAAANFELWPSFLDNLARTLRSRQSTFVLEGIPHIKSSTVITRRLNADLSEGSSARRRAEDLWLLGVNNRDCRVWRGSELQMRMESRRQEQVDSRASHRFLLGGFFSRSDEASGGVSVIRGVKEGDYNEVEHRTLESLFPHLRRALQIHLRRPSFSVSMAQLQSTLSLVPGAMLLMDDKWRVVYANQSALRIIGHGGVDLADGRLQLRDALAQKRLNAELERQMGERTVPAPPAVIEIRRLPPLSTLRFAIVLVHGWTAAAREGTPVAAIMIDDPANRPQPLPAVLQGMYGLTAAEIRLAMALFNGSSLEEAAKQFGISLHTARTQLKSIRGRMGVDSQTKVVRELSVIAGWIRPPI